jgi:hypothetical protein
MKKTISLIIVALTFLSSCGPSKAEKELMEMRAKIVADSINAEMQKEAEKQAELKQELIDLKAQLAGEEVKLQSINEFTLLRTKDEKAQQITDQTRIVEELKAQIEEVKAQIN